MMAHDNDWRSLYPFASHFLTLRAGQYHYVDEGCGEPLLMVHGNPTWSFYWRNLVLGLRDRYRTLAPDHLGCGLSDKPQDYEYTLRQHIANLVELVDALDLTQVTLLVHDWGGPSVWEPPWKDRTAFRDLCCSTRGPSLPPSFRCGFACAVLRSLGIWQCAD